MYDILTAIERIETYTSGEKEQFLQNFALQDCTLFLLQTIGETLKQLPKEMKAKYPEIPWSKIIDLRNFPAHVYWQDDFATIWIILEPNGELQQLKSVVLKLIENIKKT